MAVLPVCTAQLGFQSVNLLLPLVIAPKEITGNFQLWQFNTENYTTHLGTPAWPNHRKNIFDDGDLNILWAVLARQTIISESATVHSHTEQEWIKYFKLRVISMV